MHKVECTSVKGQLGTAVVPFAKMRVDRSASELLEFVRYSYTRLLRDRHHCHMHVDKTVTLGTNNEDDTFFLLRILLICSLI